VLLIALAVFAVDLALAGVLLATQLRQAQQQVRAGADALNDGDLADARGAFDAGHGAARRADFGAAQPAVRILGWFPPLRDEVAAVRAMASSAVLATDAGGDVVDTAEAAGWDDEHIPGFAPGGEIDMAVIREASPGLQFAAGMLADASSQVEAVHEDGLMSAVRGPFGDAKETIVTRANQLHDIAGVTDLLPSMLGADEERTYLLFMLNTADPRGWTGFPGSYTLIHCDGQRIEIDDVQPVGTLPLPDEPVPAPPGYSPRYNGFGARTNFIATTYSPDFPVNAQLILSMWDATGQPPVDGVIVAAPGWMSDLLKTIGAVDRPAELTSIGSRGPRWPHKLNENNIARVMTRDTFLTLSSPQSNDWQTAIGTTLWDSFLERTWRPNPLITGLTSSVADRQLAFWPVREEEQTLMGDLGATGTFPSDGDTPFVTFDGILPNRIGYYADRTVEVTEEPPAEDGSVRGTVTVTVENRAEAGPRSILLGKHKKGQGQDYGIFGFAVNVYLPHGATSRGSQINGKNEPAFAETELGRKVVTQFADVDFGKTVVITVNYERPAASR
jgi:hypothetical protein